MIQLLSVIFSLLRAEPLVFYPSLIFSFATSWLLRYLHLDLQNFTLGGPVFIYLGISILFQIFNQLLVADLAKNYIKEKAVGFTRSLGLTFLRLSPTLLTANFILIILTSLLYISRFNMLSTILLLPLILVFALIFQIFPAIYVSSEKSILSIFQLLYSFLIHKTKHAVFLLLFMLFIFVSTFLIFSLLAGASSNIKSLLTPLFQGLANTIIIYAIVIVYDSRFSFKVNTRA
jgi:hypothetical protein